MLLGRGTEVRESKEGLSIFFSRQADFSLSSLTVGLFHTRPSLFSFPARILPLL